MGSLNTSVGHLLGRLNLWPARVLWFVVPLLMLPGFSTTFGASVYGVWAVWFIGFVALQPPSTVSLTVVRIIGPALPVLLALSGLVNGWGSWVSVGIVFGVLLALILFLPTTGDPMINGSSYGPERRFALRPPAAAVIGSAQITWLITVAGAVTGPVLLTTGHPIIGGAAVLAGFPLAYRMGASLHQLARRWVVFVPAGFVLHDRWSMADPLLVQRRQNPMLGPAPDRVDTKPGVVDLSAGARGLALAVEFSDPVTFALRRGRDIITEPATLAVFTPTLPGRVLTEARARAIPIG